MPTNRTRMKRNRTTAHGLTADQLQHLLAGWILDNAAYPDLQFPFKDEHERRTLYFKNKEFLFSCAGEDIDGVFAKIKKGEKPQGYFDYENK